MAPRDEKLEAELFGLDPTEQHTPLDFTKYANIPVSIERGDAPPPVTTVSFGSSSIRITVFAYSPRSLLPSLTLLTFIPS